MTWRVMVRLTRTGCACRRAADGARKSKRIFSLRCRRADRAAFGGNDFEDQIENLRLQLIQIANRVH